MPWAIRHRIKRVVSLRDGPPGTCDHKLDAVVYATDEGAVRYSDFGVDTQLAAESPHHRLDPDARAARAAEKASP